MRCRMGRRARMISGMEVRPPVPAKISPPRLEGDGMSAARRKPEGGPPVLTAKHRRLMDAMCRGVDDPRVEQMTRRVQKVIDGEVVLVDRPLRRGEPLELHEAAQLVGIRQRHARELVQTHIFAREYALELQRVREGAKAGALATVIGLVHERGNGKAADRKIQLSAAKEILGDEIGQKAPGVQVNIGVQVTPGYVIRLPGRRREGDAPPLQTYEASAAGRVVRGEIIDNGDAT